MDTLTQVSLVLGAAGLSIGVARATLTTILYAARLAFGSGRPRS
jgi:hypothetical protein